MEIGFTGTQRGMTEHQQVAVSTILDTLTGRLTDMRGGHVHHGDCVGADAEFHDMAEALGLRIEIHPPIDEKKRAFKKADIKWPAYDYMTRNQHIVDCASVLIATPGEASEQRRSGTWSTIRRARRKHIPIYTVYPSGHIEFTAA